MKKSVSILVAAALLCLAGHQAGAEESLPAPVSRVSGLAYDGEFIYLSSASGSRTIFKLNPVTLVVEDSFLAPSAGGLDGRSDPNDLVVVEPGRLFASDIARESQSREGAVWEVDTDGTTIRGVFDLPFRGGGLASDGERLFIGNFDGPDILVTTLEGETIRTFNSGLRPAGLVYDPSTESLWVISQFNSVFTQTSLDGEVIRMCATPRGPDWYQGAVTLVDNRFLIAESSTEISEATPGTIHILNRHELDCSPALALTVQIDFMPGSPANVVNPRNGGSSRVAILGADDFDVDLVDPHTIRFGEAYAAASYQHSRIGDVNGDGRDDLTLRFRTLDMGIECGDSIVLLRGETTEGRSFEGSDQVRTVQCRPSRGHGDTH